jgi:hypothetical protein
MRTIHSCKQILFHGVFFLSSVSFGIQRTHTEYVQSTYAEYALYAPTQSAHTDWCDRFCIFPMSCQGTIRWIVYKIRIEKRTTLLVQKWHCIIPIWKRSRIDLLFCVFRVRPLSISLIQIRMIYYRKRVQSGHTNAYTKTTVFPPDCSISWERLWSAVKLSSDIEGQFAQLHIQHVEMPRLAAKLPRF